MRYLMILSALAALPVFSCSSAPLSMEVQDAFRDYTGELPVFPGAEGFGANTRAGRGGSIIRVTSLDASGPGTLREALEKEGPRTIIFEVAGVIDTHQVLVAPHPYVTIAGETAPSPGITIIGAGLIVNTHDVLVRHLRFRVGDRVDGPDPGGRDGIGVAGRPDGNYIVENVVIDHCSVSWAVDEGCSTWHPGVHDVTFSNCIIAENLSHAIHPEDEHSKGLLIGDYTKRIASIRNLFASNMRRSPFVKGDVSALIVNNLIYNPGSAAIHFGDIEGHGPSLGTVIGNVLITGPDTSWNLPLVRLLIDMKKNSRVRGMDNDAGERSVMKSLRSRSSWKSISSYDDAEVRVLPLDILPSGQVKEHVLRHAGARPADRDGVDQRIVEGVRNGKGRIIDSQNDVGGFPKSAPMKRPLDVPPNPNEDDDNDGYTNLEEWLHERAAECEVTAE